MDKCEVLLTLPRNAQLQQRNDARSRAPDSAPQEFVPDKGGAAAAAQAAAISAAASDATTKANAAASASQPVNAVLTALSLAPVLVSALPAPTTGTRRRMVTDALGPVFGAIVAGGGAVVCPCYDDGTNWRCG